MEMCEKGSLEGYLRGSVDMAEVRNDMYNIHKFCQEIASGMEYITSKNVIHGDLSTRKIVLTVNLICKVTDFGLSRKLDENGEYVKKGVIPWRWMALETLNEKRFTVQADVWSFGVTVWEIYSLGKLPYSGVDWGDEFIQSLDNDVRLEMPELATEDIYSKMMQCWNRDPSSRPEFSELVSYFREIRNAAYTTIQ